MTSDQIKYQELMEARRHNIEAERLGAQEIEQKHRSTTVSEKWYNDQIRLKQLEQDLKEKQYQTQKGQWYANYIAQGIGTLLTERQNTWNRVRDVFGMSKSLFK